MPALESDERTALLKNQSEDEEGILFQPLQDPYNFLGAFYSTLQLQELERKGGKKGKALALYHEKQNHVRLSI